MSTKWIISANHNKYNHKSAFEKWGFIDWKQANYSYEVGDTVYIYSTAPYKTIRYKTLIVEKDKFSDEIVDDSMFWDDYSKYKKALGGKYVRLKLLEKYDNRDLDLDKLLENGLRSAPQGPQRIRKELEIYIELVLEKDYLYPEIISETTSDYLYEGVKEKVVINRYERNPRARKECIDYYGYDCSICGLNFEKEYGELGKGFIHVHHIVPLSEIDEEYVVDPVKDLIPVCPNCHAMIHRGLKKDFLIKEIKREE